MFRRLRAATPRPVGDLSPELNLEFQFRRLVRSTTTDDSSRPSENQEHPLGPKNVAEHLDSTFLDPFPAVREVWSDRLRRFRSTGVESGTLLRTVDTGCSNARITISGWFQVNLRYRCLRSYLRICCVFSQPLREKDRPRPALAGILLSSAAPHNPFWKVALPGRHPPVSAPPKVFTEKASRQFGSSHLLRPLRVECPERSLRDHEGDQSHAITKLNSAFAHQHYRLRRRHPGDASDAD